jgi:hypothetical protein
VRKGEQTRQDIIRKAAPIFNQKGYDGAALSDLMRATGPLEKLSQEPMPTGDSCVLVIFGASGDLTKWKLIPGLYNLACEG